MKYRGKNYRSEKEKVEKNKLYSKEEAIKLVKELSNVKFDATVEVAMNLNLDVKKADQQLRGALQLPKGTGKEVANKPDQAVKLLNYLYGFHLTEKTLQNYNKLQEYLKDHFIEKILDQLQANINIASVYGIKADDIMKYYNTKYLEKFKKID